MILENQTSYRHDKCLQLDLIHLVRTSPDSAGAVDGLNLYVYVGNNPLKYIDPTGHVKVYQKSIIFSNSLVEDGRDLALIVNAPLLSSDSMVNFCL
jgi:hypothetical protein